MNKIELSPAKARQMITLYKWADSRQRPWLDRPLLPPQCASTTLLMLNSTAIKVSTRNAKPDSFSPESLKNVTNIVRHRSDPQHLVALVKSWNLLFH
jgi:hypothetical protein